MPPIDYCLIVKVILGLIAYYAIMAKVLMLFSPENRKKKKEGDR